MKSSAISTALLAVLTTLVNAQVVYNSTTHMLQCSNGGHAYCANNNPLSTNVILRCYGSRAVPGNCDDNLAGISPLGVKTSALCFESNSLAGDAACSYNGIVYPDNGNPFQLPPTWPQFLHNMTNSSVTTIVTTLTMSLNLPSTYGSLMPTAVSTGVPISPGSGGYNGSITASTGGATPTKPSPPPRLTATYIGGAAKQGSGVGSLNFLALPLGIMLLL